VSTAAGSVTDSPCSEVSWTGAGFTDWLAHVDRLGPYRSYARGAQAKRFVVKCFKESQGDANTCYHCFMGCHEICHFWVPHGVSHGAWLRDALSRKIECTAAFRLTLVDENNQILWETDGDEDVSDLHLLACFLELSKLEKVDKASVKLLFKSLKFLRSCQYTSDSICSVLAHASCYFTDWRGHLQVPLAEAEAGHVLLAQMFIAHCHVCDETCPLKHWHAHLFKRYCPLSTLNHAIMKLLEHRGHRLRLDDEQLASRYAALTRAMWTP
jgi:hypothetical protein